MIKGEKARQYFQKRVMHTEGGSMCRNGSIGYFGDNGRTIAFDDSKGDLWTEEFGTEREALEWLEKSY